MSVQKALFPGIIVGILSVIGLTGWLAGSPPITGEAAAGGGAAEVVTNQAVIMPGCNISPSYPESIQQWCGIIDQYAQENGLDPNLVSAVMLQESAGQPDAYSKSGAVGLMQVMPRDGKAATFVCKNGPCFSDRPSMQELFDPEYNISYGTRLLASMVQYHGDIREALRAYGPKDVGYYYADLVLGLMSNHQ